MGRGKEGDEFWVVEVKKEAQAEKDGWEMEGQQTPLPWEEGKVTWGRATNRVVQLRSLDAKQAPQPPLSPSWIVTLDALLTSK